MHHLLYPLLVSCLCWACQTKTREPVLFEHPLLSISYPSNWTRINTEYAIFGVSKHKKLNTFLKTENPSLIITAVDSSSFAQEGVPNFQGFLDEFKSKQLDRENYSLLTDYHYETINGQILSVIQYHIHGANVDLVQSQYFLSHLEQYVSIMITHHYNSEGHEVNQILQTLQLSEDAPLEEILQIEL
ncbi:hypothetical protein BFP72_15370 [Reichenbachiella sp. 5M10]|uniref:hypothetical protein n=1 Tax=Reichenbachiella sp. 5M10 TaxID=1889772 RepID=UPI000C144F11|nr:hypothetical protein [Reichenbachiella sp. 5M10]PIB36683.1 hypothetical protein BFP72_15370 [Reichenbachiella sp. 5M10]